MPETILTFESSGLLTTIQDQGRYGYLHMGVPSGGALNKGAARLANRLVGNQENAPVLEITIQGPRIRFKGQSCTIALTGADISAAIDSAPVRICEPIDVQSEQLLSFGRLQAGCRAYLAISGEWQVNSWLGSASAFLQNPIDILPDHVIKKGRKLVIAGNEDREKQESSTIARPSRSIWRSGQAIRVIPGPEYHLFSKSAVESFLRKTHHASNDCSRMGIRLAKPLDGVNFTRGMISSAVVPGTVQVTQSGHCVLLLGDAQTTGGYHRIANVISADMDTLSHIKPGDELRFELMTIDQIRTI